MTDTPTDAGKRCSDVINLHRLMVTNVGGWAAIRLSDGGSDDVVYDTREDAIRCQLHEMQCAYISIPADYMSPEDADAFLRIMRNLYDNNMRLADPAAPHFVTPTVRRMS